METNHPLQKQPWSLWHKVFFRFFFIYFGLQIMPLVWLWNTVAPLKWLGTWYQTFIDFLVGLYQQPMHWLVEQCNRLFFHFPATTIVNNGSGDTSVDYEEMLTFLLLAFTGALIWSILDRKRKSYAGLNYWLRTFLRYFLILNCFSYGINKLFAMQMPFPNTSQLATPLGDYLPMRFSWMFIGYSTPYEIFSGVMETVAGLLLLNRRTITLGLFIGTVVFANVVFLNLFYDIPVKLYSIHLTIYCLYLLSNDIRRLIDFFVLNKAVPANHIHERVFSKKWKATRLAMKSLFVIFFVIAPVFQMKDRYDAKQKMLSTETKPIRSGVYDVVVYAVNKDTIPASVTDTLRWRDLIVDKGNTGSVGSTDTAFRQRYRRGYFNIVPDSVTQSIGLQKFSTSSLMIANLRYEFPDSNTVILKGSRGKDSLYVLLKRSNRHFQLAEKQFHWISEANR